MTQIALATSHFVCLIRPPNRLQFGDCQTSSNRAVVVLLTNSLVEFIFHWKIPCVCPIKIPSFKFRVCITVLFCGNLFASVIPLLRLLLYASFFSFAYRHFVCLAFDKWLIRFSRIGKRWTSGSLVGCASLRSGAPTSHLWLSDPTTDRWFTTTRGCTLLSLTLHHPKSAFTRFYTPKLTFKHPRPLLPHCCTNCFN